MTSTKVRETNETRAVNVRLPIALYENLENVAKRESRTVTQQVLYIIRKEYETRERDECEG